MSCCCCKTEREFDEALLTDGAVLKNRKCTDCCCIPIFIVFIIGWVIILAFALMNGDPDRLLKPTDFAGNICGDNDFSEYPSIFIPLPNRYSYGLCVSECPATNSYVCNMMEEPKLDDPSVTVRNIYYNHTSEEYTLGKQALNDCPDVDTCKDKTIAERARRYSGLLVKLYEYKCFPVFYSTSPTLNRCLPFSIGKKKEDEEFNETLQNSTNQTESDIQKLSENLGVGRFFTKGIAEIQQCRVTIAVSCAIAVVLSILWVFLIRWILAPIIYLILFLIFAILIILGIACLLQANHLSKVQLPGDEGASEQARTWRGFGYFFFFCSAVYLIIVLVLISRIRLAIIMMEESSKAFTNNPGLILIPPLVLLLLIGFGVFFVVAALYIHTTGEVNTQTLLVNAIGDANVNKTIAYANAGIGAIDSGNETEFVNVSSYNLTMGTQAMQAYNFFAFLWVGNFIIMYAFFVMAAVVVTWYFSATGAQIDQYNNGNKDTGRLKSTPAGTLLRALLITLRYHLGTVIFGALLIAIIQFIRAIALYIQRRFLDKWKNNTQIKCILCMVNCCLQCIERMIRVISRSAFVIVIIKNKYFCGSAFEAMRLLVVNILRTGTLQALAYATTFLIKFFIVGLTVLAGFGLLQVRFMNGGKQVDSGVFPLFFVAIVSFAIASLFMNVYEACVDTIMICFYVDEQSFDGRFMPPSLAKLVGQFKHIQEARLKYEEAMHNVPHPEKQKE